ncbi:MAG TPA: TetR/AcrR family transcriptional regulator [Caulobacteraceae bacterium]|nr:TetR/AcrR family transcriptional regulator [Caulobacteraceae bacterium]
MDGEAPKTKRDLRRESTRSEILQIAGDMFLAEGFAGTSMSAIAVRLGGSKGTLYNYFESKEELLEAFVRENCTRFWETVFSFAGDGAGVRQLLTNVGEAFLRQLDRDVIRFVRVLIGEAERIPELTRVFWEAGPQAKATLLAERLEEAKARGEFDAADCQLAARQFIALIRGQFYFERLLNLEGSTNQAAVRVDIAASVDLFLKAYPAKT